MSKVVIIHGTLGSLSGNWFPWMSAQLSPLGCEVIIPPLPTPEHQSLENWTSAFWSHVNTLSESAILIGHSCGATFLLRLLPQLHESVRATFLIAPVIGTINIPEYDRLNASFIAGDYDWPRINQNGGALHVVAGADDPYVPKAQVLTLAHHLHVQPQWIPGGKHLNAEAGYTTFPSLLEMIKKYCLN